MKKLYFILLAILLAGNSSAEWFPQNSGTTNTLRSVYFTDVNTGYAVGDSGTILKTINGGINWIPQNSGTSKTLRSVHFPFDSLGFCVGDSGTILKTINGGIYWEPSTNGSIKNLSSVFFTNYYNIIDGFAVGDSGTILKTTDGGTTWETQSSGTSIPLYCVYFPDVFPEPNYLGFIVGGTGHISYGYWSIILTTYGGNTWDIWKMEFSYNTRPFRSVYFMDADTGYIVGGSWGALILKTTDGGYNWVNQFAPNSAWLSSVQFIDSETGYAVGDGIYKTTNGGTDWLEQDSQLGGGYSVHFPVSDTGYIVGVNGKILKTTNGGSYVGVNDHPQTANTLNIYPNPASDKITIEIPEISHQSYLSIYNLSGQELFEQNISQAKTVIDISTLPAGIIFIKVLGDKTVQTGKIIKQ